MHLELAVCDGFAPAATYSLHEFPTIIGRSPAADIRLPDQWMSRFHCEIRDIDGVATVRDLGSRNGTYLNGEKIDKAELETGDKLIVGLTTFAVQIEAGSATMLSGTSSIGG